MGRIVNWIATVVVVFGLAVTTLGETSVLELGVGDCFDDLDGPESMNTEIGAVPSRDCDEPHDNEVYAVRTVEGSEWPGVEALDRFAARACYQEFAPFVDLAYEESRLEVGWMVPTRTSWEDHDDRAVACFLYDMQFRKLTGSMEGSGV